MGDEETPRGRPGVVTVGRFAELEDALVERVRELRGDRSLAPLAVVVGSAPVRTRVGDLLVRRLGAVANVSILTLSRLAVDVVTQVRGAPPNVLSSLACERLVRRLVSRPASDRLRYFAGVAERPHFAKALAATFADLREARVAPDSGWAAQVADAGALGGEAKAGDLEALYDAYCRELERLEVLDRAGLYLAAAGALQSSSAGPAPAAQTILYGIYDLNEAQEAFAATLLAGGADVFVPVPRDGDERLATMLAVARRAGLAEARPAPPAAVADREMVPALTGAVKAAASGDDVLHGDGTLSVVSVSDERAEAREVVRAVLAAADEGAALWDCAAVVPHRDDVERVASGLRTAGLPVACRRPDRSAGPRVVDRLVDCLAPSAGEAFGRRALVDLLSAAPLRGSAASAHESALWLDEARRAGIVNGLEQWTDRLARRRAGLEHEVAARDAQGGEADVGDDEAGSAGLEAARVRLVADRALEVAVAALVSATAELPARAGWRAWAAALAGVVDAVFADEAAAAARDVLGRLVALDVLGEEVDLAEAANALRDQLAGSTVPEGRAGRAGIAVLTPLELRGLSFHSVVFGGLAEGGFPSRGRPDPVLGDAARRRIAEALGVRLPLAEARDAESALLFAFACDAARERLTLLAPRTEAATGRPRLPSRLLLRLASSVAGRPVGLDEFVGGAPLAAVWRRGSGASAPSVGDDVLWVDVRERDVETLLSLGRPGQRATVQAYLQDVLGDPAAVTRRLQAWRGGRDPEPGAWDGLLGGEARAALSARRIFAAEMHPTRLERYVGCPFAFLLRDVLGLEAPDEPGASLDMDAREFGTLAHGILERTYARVIAGELDGEGGLDLAATLAALTSDWETGCAQAERRGVTGATLAWEVRRRLLLDDLAESVRRDPVFARGDGRPVAVEWRFGEAHDRPVSLELDDGVVVRFAGRLDRVDALPGGARIVDYKTGKGGTEQRRLKDGLSVQLPVYQLALRQAGDGPDGEIACVYRLVTRRGGFADLALQEAEVAAAARLRRLVARIAALVDAGVFARSTGGRCEYCDVGYACGLTAWARDRKRAHPALAALVDLQVHGPGEGDDDAGA